MLFFVFCVKNSCMDSVNRGGEYLINLNLFDVVMRLVFDLLH